MTHMMQHTSFPHVRGLDAPDVLDGLGCGREGWVKGVPEPPVGVQEHPHRHSVGRVPLVELVSQMLLDGGDQGLAVLVRYVADVDLKGRTGAPLTS